MTRPIALAALVTALGCGLIAGVFFAFSSFVMPALGKLPAGQGIRAMQRINVDVINVVFLAVFVGTAAGCAVLAVTSLRSWSAPGAQLRLAGCLLYLVGTLAVTRIFNIPRNDALAALDPDGAQAAAAWAGYLRGWVMWNHVRAAAALAACTLLILSLVRSR